MERKGFTLVELLVTIVIIALVGSIGIVGFRTFFNSGEKSYYSALESNILLAGNDYYLDHREELPGENETSEVTLVDLINNKYLEPVMDSKGNLCTEGRVYTYQEGDKYKYDVCIECDENYRSKGKYCNGGGTSNSVILVSAETADTKKAYVANVSYNNAESTNGENVNATFRMADTSINVSRFDVINERTKEKVSCPMNNNTCKALITVSGTYVVKAYSEEKQIGLTHISVRISRVILVTPKISSCQSRAYDGTDVATCIYSPINEKLSGEEVVLDGGSCTFNNKNVGNDRTVTCAGITLAGYDKNNYELIITSATSKANITTRELIVTADNLSRAYGAENPTFTYSIKGDLENETPAFGGSLATSATASSPVGNYDITQGTLKLVDGPGFTASNYSLTYVKGTLTISQHLATCPTTFSGYEDVYDGSAHTITATGYSGGTIKYRTAQSGTGSTWTTTKPSRTNAGTTTVYVMVEGDANHESAECGSKTIKITTQKCNPPTNISISTDGYGKVTWTASSNCSSANYKISMDDSTYTSFGNGDSYRDKIIESTGSRTVYVKTIKPNDNYSDSDSVSKGVTVYSVSLSKGTGISTVTSEVVKGSDTEISTKFIKGETVKITATMESGFNWSKWTSNTGTSDREDNPFQHTISANWDYTANATGKAYTVHFRQGKATSSAGYDELGTQTCYYGDPCTLKGYSDDLGAKFPYSSEDSTRDNYRWAFYGWVIGGSANSSSTTRDYANSATINPSNYSSDIYLYAIGRKNYLFATGIAPTSNAVSLYQYWNPCRTTYRTSITVPAPTNLTNSGSWDFIGYYAGSGTSTTVTIAPPNDFNYNSWELTPSVTLTTAYVMRSKYQRTLVVHYNKNGGDTAPSDTTKVQVYTSGYASGGVNSGAGMSSNSITLASSGATRTGYDLSKWAEGSASGTKYNPGATYTGLGAEVTSTKLEVTMHAIWAGKAYTVHFEQGTATGSAAHEELGTQTCYFKEDCTLNAYSGTFPYSSGDSERGNYRWAFYGWVIGGSANSSSTTRDYADKAKINPTDYDADIYLYAIGRKNYVFATGIAPTENFASLYQYWNPCRTTYRTSITVPAPTKLTASSNGSWDFIGYYAGTGTTTAVTMAVPVDDPEDYDYKSWTLTPSVTLTTGYIMRSKYQRKLTVSYNKNGGDAAPSDTTLVQRYTSGYASSGANSGAGMSSNSITLASSGATRTGYNLSAWAEGSSSGTQYDPGDSYTALGATVKSTKLEETMYAKWTAKPYDITFDYLENVAYNDDEYLDTGYKVNWGRDFEIVAKFKLPELGVKHLVIGNYSGSVATNLNVEVTTGNKLRLYMGKGTVDTTSSGSTTLPQSTIITATYTWVASTKKYTLVAKASGMTDIKIEGTASMSGTATKTLLTNRDWRGTGTFKKISVSTLKITDTRDYNSALSDLPTISKSGWSYKGWYTASSGGTKISTSTKVTANKTYYAQWKTYTRKTYNCTEGVWYCSETKTNVCSPTTWGQFTADRDNLNSYVECALCQIASGVGGGGSVSISNCDKAYTRISCERTGCTTYSSTVNNTETGVPTCTETSDKNYKYTCTLE